MFQSSEFWILRPKDVDFCGSLNPARIMFLGGAALVFKKQLAPHDIMIICLLSVDMCSLCETCVS